MSASVATDRERLVELLAQRGVDKPDELLTAVHDDDLDGVRGAIAMWDDMQHGFQKPGPGLLVKKIREGGLPHYRRAHERDTPEGAAVGDAHVQQVIRSQILGAGMGRGEAREMFGHVAQRYGVSPDAWLDTVMGMAWEITPPHPCVPYDWRGDWRYPDHEHSGRRYEHVVANGRGRPVDIQMKPEPGENQWDYACRYWGWEDPEDFDEFARKIAERKARGAAADPVEDRRAKHAQERQEAAARELERAQGPAQGALLEDAPASALTGEPSQEMRPSAAALPPSGDPGPMEPAAEDLGDVAEPEKPPEPEEVGPPPGLKFDPVTRSLVPDGTDPHVEIPVPVDIKPPRGSGSAASSEGEESEPAGTPIAEDDQW